MPDYTTTALLASIKMRGNIPASQTTFSDNDLLALASEELKLGVVPFMMKFRSEYFVTSTDTSIVSGTSTYAIPGRAIGSKLKSVMVVDANGNVYPISQITKEEIPYYSNSNSNSANMVFYTEGNNVVLVPSPAVGPGVSLRLSFYFRPNDLVTVSSCAKVLTVSQVDQDVLVSAPPSTFASGLTYDFVNGSPNFDFRGIDRTCTTINNGNLFTFSGTLPTTVAVGDYLCLSGTSPVVQIPWELNALLAQRVVAKVMESQGDAQGLQQAQAKLKELEDMAQHLISPRVDGNPKKLINRNSTLRSGRSS